MKPYVDQVALEVVQIVTARQRATTLLNEWCANSLLDQAGRYMADSETESNLKRVMAVIAESGEEGITRRELRRAVRGLSIREFDEAVKQLLEEEAVAMLTRRANGAGRPAQVYVALENSVFRL